MTKLEELTALLVNEINDFKKGVEKLEKINTHLKDTKIKIDLIEYKSIIEKHQQKMRSHLNAIGHFEKRFEDQLKSAKIYPNWAVIVFLISLLFGIGAMIYVFTI